MPTKGLGHQVELLKVYSTDTQLEARLEKSGSEQLKSIDCGMDASRRGKGAMLCNITENESTLEETNDTEQTQTRARRFFFHAWVVALWVANSHIAQLSQHGVTGLVNVQVENRYSGGQQRGSCRSCSRQAVPYSSNSGTMSWWPDPWPIWMRQVPSRCCEGCSGRL